VIAANRRIQQQSTLKTTGAKTKSPTKFSPKPPPRHNKALEQSTTAAMLENSEAAAETHQNTGKPRPNAPRSPTLPEPESPSARRNGRVCDRRLERVGELTSREAEAIAAAGRRGIRVSSSPVVSLQRRSPPAPLSLSIPLRRCFPPPPNKNS